MWNDSNRFSHVHYINKYYIYLKLFTLSKKVKFK